MDNISKEKISLLLSDPAAYDIKVLEETSSTNTIIKELAENGAPEGTVVIAEKQTGGRGRLGRSFFSPPNGGIYMSLLLRPALTAPSLTLADSVKLTAAAACAVCEAIEDVTGVRTEIKWVNDIYKDGKKLCGILTEAVLGEDNRTPSFISVGIGINVYPSSFPKELTAVATSIYTKSTETDIRSELIARVIELFFELYKKDIACGKNEFTKAYKKRSSVIGKRIKVIRGSEVFEGTAVSVNDDCSLSVRKSDGDTVTLSSGEISIRPSDGERF